ncbi:MAG: DUF3124 domain-containing protein [Thermodesulfovibrionales bacterium]
MKNRAVLCALVCAMLVSTVAAVFAEPVLKKGQTVYVPAYPHVFMGPRGTVFDLSVTLMVRNTDFRSPVTVTSIDYYDTNGRLTRRHLEKPLVLGPMASTHVHITEKDTSGGIGANFVVRWRAERDVNVPLIETVMIGGKSGQGISFVSPGVEIAE